LFINFLIQKKAISVNSINQMVIIIKCSLHAEFQMRYLDVAGNTRFVSLTAIIYVIISTDWRLFYII
jgi:hypothetical protein